MVSVEKLEMALEAFRNRQIELCAKYVHESNATAVTLTEEGLLDAIAKTQAGEMPEYDPNCEGCQGL